jgi:lipopolysaccharide assembly protein A
MRSLTYILVLLIFLLGLTFACLNAESVSINYYIGAAQLPLSLLLALAFFLGGLLGLSAGLKRLLHLKRQHYRLQQRLKIVEKEIENLRVMPLKDTH